MNLEYFAALCLHVLGYNCSSLVCQGAFPVLFRAFGGEGARLETPMFVQLITLLSKWDSSLTVQRCSALKESVDGSESIVFKDVKDHAVFKELVSTPEAAAAKAPES